ncbi:MAG: hypothetical protein ABIK37_03985 [candidate division WOR-3 bacterium]
MFSTKVTDNSPQTDGLEIRPLELPILPARCCNLDEKPHEV